jgi:hypothetical protein
VLTAFDDDVHAVTKSGSNKSETPVETKKRFARIAATHRNARANAKSPKNYRLSTYAWHMLRSERDCNAPIRERNY